MWYTNGTKGILMNDPTKSEVTTKVEFTKELCTGIKNVIDSQYLILEATLNKE